MKVRCLNSIFNSWAGIPSMTGEGEFLSCGWQGEPPLDGLCPKCHHTGHLATLVSIQAAPDATQAVYGSPRAEEAS